MSGPRKKARRAGAIPPPPPAQERLALTKVEAAGLLGVRVRRIDELRRADPTFPKARLLGSGTVRFLRTELVRWLESRPTGWATTGGPRRGAFGRCGSVARASCRCRTSGRRLP